MKKILPLLLIFSTSLVSPLSIASTDWTQTEIDALTSRQPFLTLPIGAVRVEAGTACLDCGDYYHIPALDWALGKVKMTELINTELRPKLKERLYHSGYFPVEKDGDKHITINATLVTLDHHYSLGAQTDKEKQMTGGGSLTNTLTIHYAMWLEKEMIASWTVTSRGSSNSLASITRMDEAMHSAMKRNIQIFMLQVRQSLDPTMGDAEKRVLASIPQEKDDTRSVLSSISMYTARVLSSTVNAVGAVAEGVITGLADPSVQANIQANLNSISAQNRSDSQHMLAAQASASETQPYTSTYDQATANAGNSNSSSTESESNTGAADSATASSTLVLGSGHTAHKTEPSSSDFKSAYPNDMNAERARCDKSAREHNAQRVQAAKAHAGKVIAYAWDETVCVFISALSPLVSENQADGMSASAQSNTCRILNERIADLAGGILGRSMRAYADINKGSFERSHWPNEGCGCQYDFRRELKGENGNAACSYLSEFTLHHPSM